MPIINIYDYDKIHNINEKRVWEILIQLIENDESICTCRDCILDLVAITLNNIPPHYQVNEEDFSEAYRKVSDEAILMQLINAAEIVKKNPHHL
ncbi:MAG: competence protein ComFB [Deferribacteres bacterium]|jgi:competence protein ComFB|nr:hypothetical protein [Deferribacteraceae bacterium]MDK2792533.1 competence protein ComFB [Deferribacteres bacterium]